MAEKNKKLEIASAIVGGIYAAVHIALAAVLFAATAAYRGVTIKDMGLAIIFLYSVQFVVYIFALSAALFSIWCVAAVIIPLCSKSAATVRRVAVTNIIFLALRIFIDVNFVFAFIVNGFRYGDYLRALLTILSIILTVTWLVLNIIRAKIYKVGKGENQ